MRQIVLILPLLLCLLPDTVQAHRVAYGGDDASSESAMASLKNPGPAPANPTPKTFTTPGGLRMHVVQTGWVSVKTRHRELRGPAFLRLPAIMADRRWTEWLPIQFYVLEHPEGLLIFDTGETAEVHSPGYFRCDSQTEWFYLNQLRFAVQPEDELGPQMELLGLDPADVRWTVMSHLHSDHMGGMQHVVQSEFMISAVDAAGHQGALMCRIPKEAKRTPVRYDDGPFGAFEHSHRLTEDGHVAIVPTPGHTPGHQSLMVREGETYYLFAGDVVFDLDRLQKNKGLAGIVADVQAAKESVRAVQKQLDEYPTVLAPAHDGGVGLERFVPDPPSP